MELHPDPAHKLSANLYDIYHCCVYSEKTPYDGQRNCLKHVEFHFKNQDGVPSWSCLQAVSKPVWHIPQLCVQWKNSWWWTEELSETCSFIPRIRMEFHPDPACKLSANLYDIYQCYVYSEKTPDDGQRNCPKHVEFHSKNKFEKLMHLVGFIIRNLTQRTVTWMSKSLHSLCTDTTHLPLYFFTLEECAHSFLTTTHWTYSAF